MATVKYTFNPFEVLGINKPSADKRSTVLAEMKAVLEAEIRDHLSAAKSPVSGYGRFPALSKEYKAKKQASGKPGVANLEFIGDMLDALQVRSNSSKSTITVEIRGKQGDKADGHNNHSGSSNLPLRRFIPSEDDGDIFNKNIMRNLRDIAGE